MAPKPSGAISCHRLRSHRRSPVSRRAGGLVERRRLGRTEEEWSLDEFQSWYDLIVAIAGD
jgi:hypothetical protein